MAGAEADFDQVMARAERESIESPSGKAAQQSDMTAPPEAADAESLELLPQAEEGNKLPPEDLVQSQDTEESDTDEDDQEETPLISMTGTELKASDTLVVALPKADGNHQMTGSTQDGPTPDWLAQIKHRQRWQNEQSQASPSELVAQDAKFSDMASGVEASDEVSNQVNVTQPEQTDGRAGILLEAVEYSLNSADDPTQISQPEGALSLPGREQGVPLSERAQPLVMSERTLALHQAGAEQNARQMAQQVQVMVNQNMQQADIQLSPTELGGLRIYIKVEQGEASVQFLANHPQARELLEQAMPRLRDMLGQQGIQLGQGQVGSFSGQDGNADNSASDQRKTGEISVDVSEDESWEPVSGFSARSENRGLIDYFA